MTTTSSSAPPKQQASNSPTPKAKDPPLPVLPGGVYDFRGVPGMAEIFSDKGEKKGTPKKHKKTSPTKEVSPKTMAETIAKTEKKFEAKKEEKASSSPTMKPPFQDVPKPIPTVKRIVQSDGGKFELNTESQHHELGG